MAKDNVVDIRQHRNKKTKDIRYRTCPRCGKRYNTYPAISRKDNKTKICPDCGTEEDLLDYLFLSNEEHIPRID